MALPILYWQRSALYADLHYGLPQAGTSSTIGRYGCKLCCYAMLLGILPDKLQDIFVEKNCYTNSGFYNYVQDDAVAQAFTGRIQYDGRVDCQTTPAPLDIVDEQLRNNNWCMVYVDARQNMTPAERAAKPNYLQHYVLVLDKVGANYKIFDPYVGDIALIAPRYGGTPDFAIGGIIKIIARSAYQPWNEERHTVLSGLDENY